MVSVFWPCCLSPLPFFFPPDTSPVPGEVEVSEPPEVAPEEEDDCWPLEGALGRYSWPEFVAEALAANMQSTVAATHKAGIVLRAIIGSVGWRRY